MTRTNRLLPAIAFALSSLITLLLAQVVPGQDKPPTSIDRTTQRQFRVLDQGGKPIGGAHIRLIHQTQTFRELVKFKLLHETTTNESGFFEMPEGHQVANAQSFNDGFSATWVTVPARDNRPERTWLLGTSAGAYSPYMEMIYSMIENPQALQDPHRGLGDPAKIPSTYKLPECKTTVSVVKPDGSPAAGVKVTPLRIVWLSKGKSQKPIFVPPALRASLSRTTDTEGKVTFTTIAQSDFTELEFESKEHGRQRSFSNANSIGGVLDKALMLYPAGEVQGKITSKNKAEREFLAGHKLLFKSQLLYSNVRAPKGRTIQMHGYAEVEVDAEGQFTIPAMLAGRITLYDRQEEESSRRVSFPLKLNIQPDQKTALEGKVVSTIEVHGVVLKRDTGVPVPKVAVSVQHGIQSGLSRQLTVYATTDQFGRFKARVFPGQIGFSPLTTVPDYVAVYQWEQPKIAPNMYLFTPRGKRVTVPEDVDRWELPPLELVPAVKLTGQLLDDTGEPLPGTGVYGFPAAGRTNCGFAKTDVNGRFTMDRIPSSHPPRYFKAGTQRSMVVVAIESRDPLILKMKMKK